MLKVRVLVRLYAGLTVAVSKGFRGYNKASRVPKAHPLALTIKASAADGQIAAATAPQVVRLVGRVAPPDAD